MSQPIPEPDTTITAPAGAHRFQRLRRLAIKELREILRDRRTLLTLVLMPFLLYPLLSLVFRKFLFAGPLPTATPIYAVACATPSEARFLQLTLEQTRPFLERRYGAATLPDISVWVPQNPQPGAIPETPEEALHAGKVDVVLRVTKFPPASAQPDVSWEVDCDLITVEGVVAGERASRHLEDCFRTLGSALIGERLRAFRINQRPTPVRVTRQIVKEARSSSVVSLSSLIPFVLILMTITGAVYPAIDLTAGERERGTLELLIAAPVPRLGLLFAKYVAVVAVAMLTATVNLVAMTATISLSGLGPMLWGSQGLTLGTVVAVFGLLFLMASFFAAVLLAITSFARSFKEAQAYLIPLMLCALAPGLISLMPGVELEGWYLVTPLLNAALLSRDLLAGDRSLPAAMLVVVSTALYAFAALAIAAKLFAAEGVFYDARIGWSELWKRPAKSGPPGLAQALLCLACMFPVSFAALGAISNAADASRTMQYALMILATAVVYGGVPLIFAYWQRVNWKIGLSWSWPPAMSFFGSIILGLALWPIAHEIFLLSEWLGFASLTEEQLAKAKGLIDRAPELPLWLNLAAISLVPGFFEEFCFRGFVLGAFKARRRAATAIIATGILFGVFHVVTSPTLAVERLLPSTALGLVLGWVCWRTKSVFPGMLLHATHNGVLVLMIYYLPELKARGWGIEERSHLPATWLVAAAVGCLVGWLIVWLSGRDGQDASVSQDASVLSVR